MNPDNQTDSSFTFKPLELQLKEQVEAIRAASGNTLYTYTFTTLFAWQEIERYGISLREDAYLIKNGARGDNAYLFPCGTDEGKLRFISDLLEYGSPVFYFVSDGDKLFLEKNFPGLFGFRECRDDFPYLYDRDAQINMPGKLYKDLRHNVNRGRVAAGEWSFEPLRDDNTERALELTRLWAAEQDEDGLADIAATETALRHFGELSMWGLLFMADGEDIAFIAGSFVTPEIYDINFCKVLDKRCDCYIKWLLYQALPEEVDTVDSEEDMGLPGLRKHKLLRCPKELTRVWSAQSSESDLK